MMRTVRFRVWCATLLAFGATGAASGAVTNVVRMGNYFFNPTNLTINVGDSVLWTNVSLTAHDTTGPSNLWASPNLAFSGKYTFRFTNAGFYPYICALHIAARPEQTGTVTVVPVVTNPPAPVTLVNPRWVNADFVFAFESKAGVTYDVWRTSTLAPANWTLVTTVTGTGGLLAVTNRNPGGVAGTYRVQSR